ncbi:MAG TPA: hypothetical protein VM779_14005 [Thermoanaerobaculia bacterium]|nr:hypothetical protein [Thermoanaerobaculia bacterium]
MRRFACFALVVSIAAVSAWGQDRSVWRTAADIRENAVGSAVGTVLDVNAAGNRLRIQLDTDTYQPVLVLTDSVSTQYYGFGGIINGSPEIFRGSSGFANIRTGDRVDVHGHGRPGSSISASQITLLGREVEAGSVGVGTTRPGTSVSTPTTTTTTAEAIAAGYAEGTIRQVNANEGRIVIETPQRRIITVNTTRSTPVYYQGEIYRVVNLEPGDVVRIEPEPRSAAADEITARSIEVTRSVQDVAAGGSTDQMLTTVTGRVARVDRSTDMVTVETRRGQVRVDMIRAADPDDRRMRAGDLRAGQEVEIVGSYAANSDIFLASTVHVGGVAPSGTEVIVEDEQEIGDFVIVTFSGTVAESLQTSPTLVILDRATGRTLQVFATSDLVIQARNGTYTQASTLREGDGVLIKAWRDDNDNLIAQTIRMR